MGFRSTFVSEFYPHPWPDWFRQKYEDYVYIPESGVLAAKYECKWYFTWQELLEDIQKAIVWSQWDTPRSRHTLTLVFLHECGGITRAHIRSDEIVLEEPLGWSRVSHGTHGDQCDRPCYHELHRMIREQDPALERWKKTREQRRVDCICGEGEDS